jgi:hypothetical protein
MFVTDGRITPMPSLRAPIARVVTDDEVNDFLQVNQDAFAYRPDPNSLSGVDGDNSRRLGNLASPAGQRK